MARSALFPPASPPTSLKSASRPDGRRFAPPASVYRMVVASDLTRSGEHAIAEAVRLSKQAGPSELHVVHVLRSKEGRGRSRLRELDWDLTVAEMALRDQVSRAGSLDYQNKIWRRQVHLHVLLGGVAEAIQELADQVKADVVLLGPSRREMGTDDHVALGIVQERVRGRRESVVQEEAELRETRASQEAPGGDHEGHSTAPRVSSWRAVASVVRAGLDRWPFARLEQPESSFAEVAERAPSAPRSVRVSTPGALRSLSEGHDAGRRAGYRALRGAVQDAVRDAGASMGAGSTYCELRAFGRHPVLTAGPSQGSKRALSAPPLSGYPSSMPGREMASSWPAQRGVSDSYVAGRRTERPRWVHIAGLI